MSGAARKGTRRARGYCPTCDQAYGLRADGLLPEHRAGAPSRPCDGAGQPAARPAGPAPDRPGARALREAATAWEALGAPREPSPVAVWLLKRADNIENGGKSRG